MPRGVRRQCRAGRSRKIATQAALLDGSRCGGKTGVPGGTRMSRGACPGCAVRSALRHRHVRRAGPRARIGPQTPAASARGTNGAVHGGWRQRARRRSRHSIRFGRRVRRTRSRHAALPLRPSGADRAGAAPRGMRERSRPPSQPPGEAAVPAAAGTACVRPAKVAKQPRRCAHERTPRAGDAISAGGFDALACRGEPRARPRKRPRQSARLARKARA